MKRIVVGVDGSSGAANALRWASQQVMGDAEAELVAMSGLPHPHPDVEEEFPTVLADREQQLALWSEHARQGDVPVRTVVEVGDPRPAILEVAEREDAQLVVIGREGTSAGPGLFATGSMAEWLAHHTDRPLAVVGGAVNLTTRRVLVGVDGSPGSHAALRWVRDMWSGSDVPIIAAAVEQPYLEWTRSDSADNWRRAVERRIGERDAAELVADGFDVTPQALRGSNAAECLLRAAKDERTDVIVVGARGTGGFSGLRIGGVALKVLHRADRPVVIVPASYSPAH